MSGFCLHVPQFDDLEKSHLLPDLFKAYGSIKVGSWWKVGKMPEEKKVCFKFHYINVCFNHSTSMMSIESNATLKVTVQKQ